MLKKIKSIINFIGLFWLGGGGFILALLGFIWTWKLALAIFCVWGCSWVITIILLIGKAIIEYESKTKVKEE